MKRSLLLTLLILLLMILLSSGGEAKTIDDYNNSIEEIKDSISDETREDMAQLGVNDADVNAVSNVSLSSVLNWIGDQLAESASRPFSVCALLTAVILLASLLESYTFSLRYVDTKEVMNVVTSLMIITVLVTPVTELIENSLNTVKGAASMMLIYIPVMVGIMVFSGHIVQSGGYCATVMTACQGISQLSSAFFAPMLNVFLAISVSSAISDRVKLTGICDTISKVIKWTLAFVMTIFTAILSFQGIAANAVDSAASKAVRFTLSSFIPIIGSSISEAYKSIEGSVNLLRSGIGVFVLIAVIVTFLPLIVQILLWQLSILAAKTVAETFGVSSTVTVLSAVSSALSILLAVIASMVSVFLISTGVLLSIGGAS